MNNTWLHDLAPNVLDTRYHREVTEAKVILYVFKGIKFCREQSILFEHDTGLVDCLILGLRLQAVRQTLGCYIED